MSDARGSVEGVLEELRHTTWQVAAKEVDVSRTAPQEGLQQRQEREMSFFAELISHFRTTMQVTSDLLRQYEGALWSGTEGVGMETVGDGTTVAMLPAPYTTETSGSSSPRQAQEQVHSVLKVLEDLQPVEEAIQRYLPATLRGPVSGRPLGVSEDSTPLLSPSDAIRSAVLLHGRSLLLRDAYLLSSLLHMKPSTLASVPPPGEAAEISSKRRLAQGLMLLKQSNQMVDAHYFSSSVMTLLLPYTNAASALDDQNDDGVSSPPPQSDGQEKVTEWVPDTSDRELYGHVVRHTKSAYKAESRLSMYAHELKSLMDDTVPQQQGAALTAQVNTMELRHLVQKLIEEFNVLRGSKNELQLCVLQAHAGHYDASLKRGRRAVQVLSSLCRQYSGSLQTLDAGGLMGNSQESSEVQSFVLLPVALYNLACTLDLVGRDRARVDPSSRGNPERREARDLFFQSFRLAEQFLGPAHELVRELNRVFGPQRLEKWKKRLEDAEVPGGEHAVASHPSSVSGASSSPSGGKGMKSIYLSSSSASAASYSRPAPLIAAPYQLTKKPPYHLPSSNQNIFSAAGDGIPNAPIPSFTGSPATVGKDMNKSLSIMSSSVVGMAKKDEPFEMFSPSRSQRGSLLQPSPAGPLAFKIPLPPRADGTESVQSGGAGSAGAPGVSPLQAFNRSMTSVSFASKKGSYSQGRRGSMKSMRSMKSMISSLRSSHRLENPDDALNLGGPTPEFVPPNIVKEQEIQRRKEEKEQKRRERRIRVFLPEDIERKRKLKEAKEERRRKRERHTEKKELYAKREKARAAAAEAEALLQANLAYYAQLDKENGEVGGSEQNTTMPSAGVGGEKHSGTLGDASSKPASPDEVHSPTDGHKSDALSGQGEKSFLQSVSGKEGDARPGSKRAGKAVGGKAGKQASALHKTASASMSASGALAERLDTARPDYAKLMGEDDDDLSSLSSTSLPLSSIHSSEEEEEEAEETVEERKDRFDIEMQIFYLCLSKKRQSAACIIQRAWRCSVARLELYNRRQFFYSHLYKRQKAAALCIVGFLRSMVNKKRVKERLAQRRTDDLTRSEKERRELAAVKVLERFFGRELERKHTRDRLRQQLNIQRDSRLSKYEAAAIIVQRWWRIIPEVRAYWSRRAVEVVAEREAQELAQRQYEAATRIQSVVRGMQTRKQVRRYKVQRVKEMDNIRRKLEWSTDLVKLALTEWCLRAKRMDREAQLAEKREYEAVQLITHGWQNALARRRFELALAKARQIRQAAECIQRAYKRHYAARERRYLRELSLTAEKERVDKEFRIYRATLTLQCFGRVVLAKAAYRRQRARYGRGVLYALSVLQSVGRGALARRQFNADRLDEYEARRVAAETAANRRKRNLEVIQGWVLAYASAVLKEEKACKRLYDKIYIRRLVRMELKAERAAVIIQKAFRRYQKLKADFYADYERQCAESAALLAVVKIQCAWRQRVAREEVRKMRWEAHKAAQKRLLKEDVLAAQWVTDLKFLYGEYEHERRRISNLESDRRETLRWLYERETAELFGAAAQDTDTAPPVNVTAALEEYLNKQQLQHWSALYDDDDED